MKRENLERVEESAAPKEKNMRLRIFDLNTPWFWLTMFFNRPSYGKPKFELSIWGPHKWRNWWVYVWKWEQLECERGSYALEPKTEEIHAKS